MFNKDKIIFTNHPHMKGYAKLRNLSQAGIVLKLGGSAQLNSHEFEKFQHHAEKNGMKVFWIS